MIKLPVFLVFIFIRAVFVNTYSNNLEAWKIGEDGDVEQYNPVEFLYDHTYIILRTQKFAQASRTYSEIYFIVAPNLKEESRIKMINHIIEIWRTRSSQYVKLIRKTILSSTENISDIIEQYSSYSERLTFRNNVSDPVEVFRTCVQPPRLYKLSRNNDKLVWQIPILNGLTLYHDFLLECDSKVLVFNMANAELTNYSLRLAHFIVDRLSVFTKIWRNGELPPDWFQLRFFTNTEARNYKKFYSQIKSNNNSNLELNLNLELTEYPPGANPETYLGVGNPLQTRLDAKNCYILQNNLTKEIAVFLGSDTNFEQKEFCLIEGEKLAMDKKYVVSVVQEENLTASFILAFEGILNNFPQTLEKPSSHIMKQGEFPF